MLKWFHDEKTTSEDFTRMFGKLKINEHTEFAEREARKYKVLRLDLCPDISPNSDEATIRARFNATINCNIKCFKTRYTNVHFEIESSCVDTLQNLVTALNTRTGQSTVDTDQTTC